MRHSTQRNMLSEKYLIAERIIDQKDVSNPDMFLVESPRQCVLGAKRQGIIHKGGHILLDFGEEICGGIEITFSDMKIANPKVRISFGESVMEAMSEIGYKGACNDHSVRDSIYTVSKYSNFRTGYTGFRFVKIESTDADLCILGVRAVSVFRDIEYRGSFSSSDPLLDKIWLTGAKTVHLCMQDYLWDAIKRDRLVWVGDMHAEICAIMSVFGHNPIVEESLDLIRDCTEPGQWMNGIPSYSLWWIIIRRDWYMYTGDKEYVVKNGEYIKSLIKNILFHLNPDGTDTFAAPLEGLEKDNPYKSYFVDWDTYGKRDSRLGFYSVCALCLEASKTLLEVIGDTKLAKECEMAVERIRKMSFPEPENKQIGALSIISGINDADEMNEKVLKKAPEHDISAYLGYYTLLAKGQCHDVKGALNVIRKYWGEMIRLGATSFWESFDCILAKDAHPIDSICPDGKIDIHGDGGKFCYKGYRASLCHGWACGPTPFITRYVLGVNPIEPGCCAFEIKPDLGDLEYVRGTYPTTKGNIEIYAYKSDGKTVCEINAPEGIKIKR